MCHGLFIDIIRYEQFQEKMFHLVSIQQTPFRPSTTVMSLIIISIHEKEIKLAKWIRGS